jgi:cupin fold WbuC family metalloprotein
MLLPLKKINNEVFIATDEIVCFDKEAIIFLKEKAQQSSKGRSRICAHKHPEESLHEMLIAISSESYIRPHRHLKKTESFHLIEGEADIIIFLDDGSIKDVIRLSESENFYYRLDIPSYHSLLIHSPVLVIHEVTNGPFDSSASELASFSPEEGSEGVKTYIDELKIRAKKYS